MDSKARLRVVLVGFLTLGVMVGVVAAALRARSNGTSDDALSPSILHRPRGDGEKLNPSELPPECLPNRANPGKIQFELPGDVLDLGSLKQGTTIERDVVVRNIGPGILCAPGKPSTGCRCVTAEWVGKVRLGPGESGITRVLIDTSGRDGHVEKEVGIWSNDPDRPEAKFHVRFDVKLSLIVAATDTVKETVVLFGQHAPGKPGTAVVRLKAPRDGPDWKVTAVEGTNTKLTWSAAPVEPDDPALRQIDVTITHPGSLERKLHKDALTIRTTHPERKEIVLEGWLDVEDKFFTRPPNVSFGFVGGPTGVVASHKIVTVLAGESGTTFRVTKAELTGEGFSAGEPVDHGAAGWQIEILYDQQKRPPGPVEAKLIIHIDDAELPRLEVPIRAESRS